MTSSNVQDESSLNIQGIYTTSNPIKINSIASNQQSPHSSNLESGVGSQPEIAYSKESNSLSLYDEDNVSQHSVDGYHGDINEDTTATKSHHHRKQKKSFFERIGLRKKSTTSLQPAAEPHYTATCEIEEQPQITDEDDDDIEEEEEEEEESSSSLSSAEEEEEEEEGPIPQISISSPTFTETIATIETTASSSSKPQSPHHKYYKTKTKNKRYHQEFSRLMLAQTIHTTSTAINDIPGIEPSPNYPYGAIWSIRFSKDGKYLASAGQNCVILLWKLIYQQQSVDGEPDSSSTIKVLDETPFREYKGHQADILDLAWSKNNFLLSSSMDNTVRLWHTTQKDCLCVFQHLNFVTSIEFHPKDDRFFLSGSMDGRIRIWSIPEKRVAFWNEIPDNKFATAIGFTLDGKTVIAGSHDGHCYFFETQSLKYNTQISVLNTNGRNSSSSKKSGPKITGIEVMPGSPPGDEKILITSNDSRVRLYNMKDKSLMFKYKGSENDFLQIQATFSDDGRYIISGSEDCHTYIWRTEQQSTINQLQQETRNKAMSALGETTFTSFENNSSNQSSPHQQRGISKWLKGRRSGHHDDHHSSKNFKSKTEYFEAHDHVVTAAIFAPTKTRQYLAKSKQDTIYNHTPMNLRRLSTASSGSGSASSFFAEDSYPDGHIIITADYRGILKVWRIDSGSYTNNNHVSFDTHSLLHASESSLATNSSSSSANNNTITATATSPKARRNFGGLFSSRHPK